MWRWLQALRDTARPGQAQGRGKPIPDLLWRENLLRYPFLLDQRAQHEELLRGLCVLFLDEKEFHGAGGLNISDELVLAIAAQACLPVLHLGLAWYDDFVGIVVHPGEVVAEREDIDDAGVIHRYKEALVGEAMHQGPVMLSWQDVQQAGRDGERPYNVVVHEFAHKLDLRDGAADACPPLPPGFMGAKSATQARGAWLAVLQSEYQAFRERATIAERFSGAPTWLDPYAASAIDEFFAVACEAYFVDSRRFATEHPSLLPLFDAFFKAG